MISAAERPAPDFLAGCPRLLWWVSFFAVSFLAHVAVAALFLHAPVPPPAGIGLEAISVDVVFGADAPAGIATEHAENEQDQPQPPADQELPPVKEEAAQADVVPEPIPAAPQAAPETALPERKEQEREKLKEDTQSEKEAATKKVEAPPPSQAAAGGVGRGQSRSDANYNGRVAAHLARHKRFPEGAQGKRRQGTAVVTFSLDGRGTVIAVKLVHSSGVPALDREAEDIVRRASPFPVPPSRGTVEFTVPLNFQQR